MNEELCHCGKPALHYNNPHVKEMMLRMVETYGPTVNVTVGKRTWIVPRHYIALHGLVAAELPSLGFPEITT